jgi:hypothetical protein
MWSPPPRTPLSGLRSAYPPDGSRPTCRPKPSSSREGVRENTGRFTPPRSPRGGERQPTPKPRRCRPRPSAHPVVSGLLRRRLDAKEFAAGGRPDWCQPKRALPRSALTGLAARPSARRAKTVGGDFNGDGKADVAAFYEYADAQTKIYVFDDVNGANVKPRLAWDSGKGNWAWSNGTTPLS